MTALVSPAILLRRLDHGDFDLILTLFTRQYGKISAIAKSAKKSVKRFSGALELFSELEVVCKSGKGLPILQEATLLQPFSGIRVNIRKAAYASYWAELIKEWMEEQVSNPAIYSLFRQSLEELHRGEQIDESLSILFQIRFLQLAGFLPDLNRCGRCGVLLDDVLQSRLHFEAKRGALYCAACVKNHETWISLSKGTVKQLIWVGRGEYAKALRIRFTAQAIKEGLEMLETFVPFHLGKEPRSLAFLRQIRT